MSTVLDQLRVKTASSHHALSTWDESKHPRGEHGHFARSTAGPRTLEQGEDERRYLAQLGTGHASVGVLYNDADHVLQAVNERVGRQRNEALAATSHGELASHEADEIHRSWVWSSTHVLSRALQSVVARHFGLASVDAQPEDENHHDLAERFFAAQYARQQQYFHDHGVTHVTLYRGLHYKPEDVPSDLQHITRDTWHEVSVGVNPLSSWTISPEIAREYAEQRGRHGYIISSRVPVEMILGDGVHGLGSPVQGEHVVIGHAITSSVTRVR